MEDNLLPSPSELQAYKDIEPKIVDFLLESSTKEQAHRHKMDEEKMKVVKYTERKNGRMNWWGHVLRFSGFDSYGRTFGFCLISRQTVVCRHIRFLGSSGDYLYFC